jgi:ABC-type multidrug transport system ATPase subunit
MIDPLWRLDCARLAGRGRPRLDAVSLEIPTGATAILGPSGAGKSSLINLLVGFEQPQEGQINRCFEAPSGRLPLFWSPAGNGLWPHLTVEEHLRSVADRRAAGMELVESLLDGFDLTDKSAARPDQLSQGESARLAVARALAADPAVLVLDEPLVHVDSAGAWKYWAYLQEHRRKRGPVSLVFSSHSPEVVMRDAEHVICLDEGRLVYSGAVQELYHSPPTPELAWSLGPVNWITAKESARWLADEPDLNGARQNPAYRPERLTIAHSDESPLVIERVRPCGAVEELELLNESTGERRTFFHRPQSRGASLGARIVLKILAIFTLCFFPAACAPGDQVPDLPVKKSDSWSMPAEGASIPAPRAVHATANGELYVLDNAGRVLVFNEAGELQRQWWMPDYAIGKPEKIVQLQDGRLAVADTHYHRVVFFDREGNVLQMLGAQGHEPGQFIYPVAVAEDDARNLYVGEYGDNDRVQKFDKEGKFLLEFGRPGTGPGEFLRPSGMLWHDGRIYVVDAFNNRIQVFAEDGTFQKVLGGEEGALHYPYDIGLGAEGELFVVEYAAGRVSKFDRDGNLLGRCGRNGSGEREFITPWGLAVDRQSRVFVADTGNRRIIALEF